MRAITRAPHEVIDLTTVHAPVPVGGGHVRLVVALLVIGLTAPAIVTVLWWSAVGWG